MCFMHMNSSFKVSNEHLMLLKLDKCLSHYLNGNLRDEGENQVDEGLV